MSATTTRPQRPLAGREHVAEFRRAEGDGHRGPDRRARDGAAVGIQARGDVRGNHRPAARVDRFDRPLRAALEPAAEARPEERVHDAVGLGQRAAERCEAFPRAERGRDQAEGPRPGQVDRGVATVRGRIPEREEVDRDALLREQSGRREPVASIVAGPADDGGALPVGEGVLELPTEPVGRALHELVGRRAAPDRRRIGGAHPARVQDRDHGLGAGSVGFSFGNTETKTFFWR